MFARVCQIERTLDQEEFCGWCKLDVDFKEKWLAEFAIGARPSQSERGSCKFGSSRRSNNFVLVHEGFGGVAVGGGVAFVFGGAELVGPGDVEEGVAHIDDGQGGPADDDAPV